MKPAPPSAPVSNLGWSILKDMHVGRRERQEDAVGVWENRDQGTLFAVVADGAGGHGGGAEASSAAVAEAGKCWEAWAARENTADFLTDWLARAHKAVNRSVRQKHLDARTVAVALHVQKGRAEWVHAGDCRLYHFRQGILLSRTRDDSVVQVLYEKGEITEEDMGTHEDQNRLLQAIGGSEPPRPRRGSADLEPDDVLLLCSDGFWERLKPEEMASLTTNPRHLRKKSLAKTLRIAVDRGEAKADNASVVMIHFDGGNATPGASAHWLRWLLLALLIGNLIAWWLVWKRLH